MTSLNINQIKRYLPHRYPFLLVDAVDEVVPNESIRARKSVSVNEPFFAGHFPGNPVMPGVLQIEAMAQAGALLAAVSGARLDPDNAVYVTGITDCRFKRPVVPGDVLELRAAISKRKLSVWKLACEARVNGAVASSAVITATTARAPGATQTPDGFPEPGFGSE
ncbi:MAG TPA: 3-hydroxyacyl-ACP dehydratase FabZ [Myxococcales bacterium LLY-WYZ-16_1]|jgi:3-hydroxyacyl-[acyl-carrier-protein] dehydratase|nr:3-hydroxyacyl-ACP dehydratase FabZ [Myxococcales bacterium LLY-WYZ-16_1]